MSSRAARQAPPPPSTFSAPTNGWNSKVADRALSSLNTTTAVYRGYAKTIQTSHGHKAYEAAAHLNDLIDATGSEKLLHRLKEAKGYYLASTSKSRMQVRNKSKRRQE